ncbi:hypothetical protein SynA1560_01462 [Synechococcus sp. A15-60]|nr:hypothetical protein SynA1560_01462 [Synechococcus sp. A15-60]
MIEEWIGKSDRHWRCPGDHQSLRSRGWDLNATRFAQQFSTPCN